MMDMNNRSAYPLRFTPMAPDGQDFDYGAFLRDDAMDFSGNVSVSASASSTMDDLADRFALGGGDSASPPQQQQPAVTTGSGSTTSSSTDVARATAAAVAAAAHQTQRQRLERRGHTKSRRGCFNCKRRRIKCQESRPACGHCVKTGLKCEYPAIPQVIHQPHHQIPLFSLQDMRFFQHFLLNCYPPYPLAGGNVWTHEVPCLSQTYEYLMHALLGLAASDLMQADPSLVPFAIAHRTKAIKAVRKRLTEISRSTEVLPDESNAMVATCVALTFQSMLLDDGMAEFMVFIRGMLIVVMQMWMKGISPILGNMMGDDADADAAAQGGVPAAAAAPPQRGGLPLAHRGWVDGAREAIQGLRGLCSAEVEVEYFELLMDWVQKLYTSSMEAHKALRKHYSWWMKLPHDKFRCIIDPTNQVMVLLSTHWIALKQMMAFIPHADAAATARMEDMSRSHAGAAAAAAAAATTRGGEFGPGSVDPGVRRWLRWLNRQVDLEHGAYNTWPAWVEERLDGGILATPTFVSP